MTNTDRVEPRRPWMREGKAQHKQWIARKRARVRDALSHREYERATKPLRKTRAG